MERKLNRRQFGKACALYLLAHPIIGLTSTKQKLKILQPELQLVGGFKYNSRRTSSAYIGFFNLQNNKWDQFEVPFLAHQVVQNPNLKNEFVAIQRRGRNLAIANLKTKRIRKHLKSPNGMFFYGHAVYSQDGQWIYATGIGNKTQNGIIFKINHQSGEIIKYFSSYGSYSHDLMWASNDHLFISNTGGDQDSDYASIVEIDPISGKLNKMFSYEKKPRIHFGHFCINPKFIFVQKYEMRNNKRTNGSLVKFNRKNGYFSEFPIPAALKADFNKEMLSIEISAKSDIVGVTLPKANKVAFFSTSSGNLIDTFRFNTPTALKYLPNHHSFSVTDESGTTYLNQSGLSLKQTTKVPHPYSGPFEKFFAHSTLFSSRSITTAAR